MIILGIDPALAVTGYGVISVKKNILFLLEAGIISTSSKEQLPRRIDKIHRAAIKLISDTKPDALVLEKLYVHYRHPTTAYLLGQARGVICLACAEKNVTLVEYGATRVKKAIVGRGSASKLQVQRMVASLLNLSSLPKYTDVSDALALAIAHSYISKAISYGAQYGR
jgi:crossover junction endodeoxyribonuclease RuvC